MWYDARIDTKLCLFCRNILLVETQMNRPSFPVGIRKCKRPKMADHRGRTWDVCTVILPDGLEINGYYDTTWGERFYFQYAGSWW